MIFLSWLEDVTGTHAFAFVIEHTRDGCKTKVFEVFACRSAEQVAAMVLEQGYAC